MEFLDMTWKDFKSFSGEHYLDFRKYRPGLYFVRGENRLEPDLGSNGAAKSSIFDAMHWCLFGTGMRGTRSPDLVPWDKTGNPTAKLRIQLDEKVTIRRSYKPGRLSIEKDGKITPVTQDQLENVLGLTSDTFQNSIVIGQFTRLFFDLRPREKMTIFSELLDLDSWLVRSKHASSTASELEKEKEGLLASITKMTATIAEIRRVVGIDEKEARTFTRRKAREKQELREKRKGLIAEKKRLRECLFLAKGHLTTVEKNISGLQEKLNAKLAKKDELRDDYVEFSSKIVEVRTKISGVKEQRLKLKKAKGSCPTCGQDISDQHRRRELKTLGVEGRLLTELERRLKHQRGFVKRRQVAVDENIEKLRTRINEQESIEDIRREVRDTERDLVNNKEGIHSCDLSLKSLEHMQNLYIERVKDSKHRIKKFRESIEEKKQELKLLENLIKTVKYWVQGFKDIRLSEVGEALNTLEVEINGYLTDLGMVRWNVHLDVERETKSGGTSRNFHVIVDPGDEGSRPKPWEAWSGGEGQRLRLAGTLALANLILKRYNRSSNLQVFDEKLIFLSGTGEEDMLTLLRETAIREKKVIFVIDQHSLDYPFDGYIDIIKDKNGSRLVA